MSSGLSNLADKPVLGFFLPSNAQVREPVNKEAAPGISAVGLRIGFG